jgi:hypothetical protein
MQADDVESLFEDNALKPFARQIKVAGEQHPGAGKFRLRLSDTFSGDDSALDFSDRAEAIAFAQSKAGQDFLKLYLYDHSGELVFSC